MRRLGPCDTSLDRSEMCAVHCEKGEVSVQALKEEGGSTVRVLLNGKMLLLLPQLHQ